MKAISGIGKSKFETSGNNFIRHQTLNDASTLVTSKIEQLSIFGDYGIHANVDRQKFTTKFNTMKSRYAKKYFGLLKGVVMYSLNTNHLAFST